MKKTLPFLFLLLTFFLPAWAEKPVPQDEEADTITLTGDEEVDFEYDSLRYETGTVTLGNNLATFKVPAGFKYLGPDQSEYVLETLWGNPPGEKGYGMIFPEEANDFYPQTWAIEIYYEEDGHVKDDDAEDIDYKELLEEMQGQVKEANIQRKKMGYSTVQLTGWASEPYYDKSAKKLHWAKKLLFEGDSAETLNYNIRILGRKGVLVLNAIGMVSELGEIKAHVNPILSSVNFTEGNAYADYNESMDKVAAYGIGGLIAGGVLAKTGLLAKIGLIFAKFAKVIIIGIGAVGAGIVKFFRGGRGNNDEGQA
jgi:uncharacterized membrane-anchored protein